MSNATLTNQLQDFGLTKNESHIYLTLLHLGNTTVGPIVEKTKIHRQAVYSALEKLVDMHLVSVVTIRNRKHYQASKPTVISDKLKQKQKEANALVQELLKIKSDGDVGIDVRISYGERAYFENLIDFIRSAHETDGIERIMGGADDSIVYSVIGPRYKEYTYAAKKYNVQKHLIAAKEYSSAFKENFLKEKNTKMKTVPGALISPTYTRITPEMISIEVVSEDQEVMIVQIRNKAIAQAYLNHFNILWKTL